MTRLPVIAAIGLVLAVVLLASWSPTAAADRMTPTLIVTTGPQDPTVGDTVSVTVSSVLHFEHSSPGANNTTVYSNYTTFSPGPVSVTIRAPNGTLLAQSCEACPLVNGTFTTFVPTDMGMGDHAVYVFVTDNYTKQSASTFFQVRLTAAQVLERERQDLAAYEAAMNRTIDEKLAAISGALIDAGAVTVAAVLIIELRRAYVAALAKNVPTWVDNVKATFGVRRNPFMKVQRSNKPKYGAAREAISEKEMAYNRRVLNRSLSQMLEVLEMGKAVTARKEELTRVKRATRIAIGLPAEPGDSLKGLVMAGIGSDPSVEYPEEEEEPAPVVKEEDEDSEEET